MKRLLVAALAGCSLTTILAANPAWAQVERTGAQPQSGPRATPSADEAADEKEIVVTGTLIRGIAPVGSNVVGVSQEQIRASGVGDANQLLGQLPQSNFFNALPEPGNGVIGAGTGRVPLSRPNLRNLPLGATTSGAFTLVLMDGHRVVPAGIEQSIVDVGVIQLNMLDRVEAILDGASAVYGSDAVGGVLNYITRKRFDGVQGRARYGMADDYWQADGGVTVGKTWGSGGFSLSYEFAKNSNLLNGERDYETPINWINPRDPITGAAVAGGAPLVDDLACDVPNVRSGTTGTGTVPAHVSGAGLAARPIYCADNAYETLTPAQRRHAVFAVFQQDITDWLGFDVTGFYSNRLIEANEGPFRANGAIIRPFTTNGLVGGPPNPGGNPFFRCDASLGVACNAPHRVDFSYGPVFGNDSQFTNTTTEVWQITPTLTADVGSGWQVRGQFSYGRSHVKVEQDRVNPVLQSLYLTGSSNSTSGPFPAGPLTTTTAINPYDIASSNPTLLDSLIYRNRRDGIHEMKDVRVIGDGPLFALPGGDVRLAVGVEWMEVDFKKRTTTAPAAVASNPFTSTPAILGPYVPGNVKSKSAFGEIVIPVFGEGNATPGLDHLILSASARYDDYGKSGGGDTLNPKFGITYGPFPWITLRANWGKSFRAPNAADKAGQAAPTVSVISAAANLQNILNDVTGQRLINAATGQPYPCITAGTGGCLSGPAGVNPVYITLMGTDPDLTPETSTNWAIGGDISPPFVPGLTLSATYWNIRFKDIISLPQGPVGQLSPLFTYLMASNAIICRGTNDFVSLNPCKPGGSLYAAAQAFVSGIPGGQGALDTANAIGDMAYLVDPRTTNLGVAKVRGIDASVNYRTNVGFGSIDASLSGAWLLKADLSVAPGAPFTDRMRFDTPNFRLTGRIGADVGNLRAQATYRHQSGFIPDPGTVRDPSQTSFGPFDVIDLAFVYRFDGTDMFTKDLQLEFNINNVLDANPIRNKTTAGNTNPLSGQTIGRFFQFGVSKRF